MARERCPDDAPSSRQDVDDTGRYTRFHQQFAEPQHGERRQFGGLQDHGAACGQRRCQLPGRGDERAIPRNDLSDDTHRLMPDVTMEILSRHRGLEQLAMQLRAPAGVVTERVRRMRHFEAQARVVQPPAIEAFEFCKFLRMRVHQLGDAPENLLALCRRQSPPATVFERLARRADGPIDIGFNSAVETPDRAARGRIDGDDAGRVAASMPGPVEQKRPTLREVRRRRRTDDVAVRHG